MAIDFNVQQPQPLPTYAWAFHSQAPAAPPVPNTIQVQTAFVNQPAGHRPASDDTQFTSLSKHGPSSASEQATSAGIRAANASNLQQTSQQTLTPAQEIAENRMKLLAIKYAMKASRGAEGERELQARLNILNAKLAAVAPIVTEAHRSLQDELTQRADERAARRAARLAERGQA